MLFDFSHLPFRERAYSNRPMTFCDPDSKNALSAIVDILAVETGSRKPREHWQAAQLQNLLGHAANRSAFWKRRIAAHRINGLALSPLPVLTRSDIIAQVGSEGSLLNARDGIGLKTNSTSGSSGTPVTFHVSEMNVRYNQIRYVAQYFLEGRDLTLNRVACNSRTKAETVQVTKEESWLGPLSALLKSGSRKRIDYLDTDLKGLRAELERDPIGYLACAPWTMEEITQAIGPAELKQAGMKMWLCIAGSADPKLREAFASADIPVRASYSAEEVGPIGFECTQIPGNYHVATSNVTVEVSNENALQMDGQTLGRVLVTHLHSYATPFIRYDLGDVAALAPACGCGHDGPTLSRIYGRSKNLLKRADGSVSAFYIQGTDLAKIGTFTEFRIRQIDLNTLTLELGGRTTLEPKETEEFVKLIKGKAGDEFNVAVKPVAEIDWGKSTKRLAFHNPLL